MTFTVRVTGDIDNVLDILENFKLKASSAGLFVFDEWGRDLRRIASNVSPSDKLRSVDPRRRGRKRFRDQWFESTERLSGVRIATQVGNFDPRTPFIIGPTAPRKIPRGGADEQKKKGYPMRFFWTDGPTGARFYSAFEIKGGVAARGTEANPVHETALTFFNLDRRVSGLANFVLREVAR